MAMNRRNVLIGLGTIAVGGGAAFASGAFTTVTADRTVTATTEGDGNAYVQFTNTDGTYVDTSGGDNTNELQMAFDSVNENAVSEFDSLFDITMGVGDPSGNSAVSDTYYVYVTAETGVSDSEPLDIETSGGDSLVGTENAQSIEHSGNWGSVSDIGVTIDTNTADISTIPDTISFNIEDTDPSSA